MAAYIIKVHLQANWLLSMGELFYCISFQILAIIKIQWHIGLFRVKLILTAGVNRIKTKRNQRKSPKLWLKLLSESLPYWSDNEARNASALRLDTQQPCLLINHPRGQGKTNLQTVRDGLSVTEALSRIESSTLPCFQHVSIHLSAPPQP